MYFSEQKIWDFRKYGGTSINNKPAVKVDFIKYLNILVGERRKS